MNKKIEYYVVDENLKIIRKFRLKISAVYFILAKINRINYGKLEILPKNVYDYQKSEKNNNSGKNKILGGAVTSTS